MAITLFVSSQTMAITVGPTSGISPLVKVGSPLPVKTTLTNPHTGVTYRCLDD
jgi:hypothetical protein